VQADIRHTVADYPRGRVPRAVREAHVLGLAEQLFLERGYQGASMDELAKRADVSKPVIYDLVGSKDELFRRLVDKAATALADAVTSASTGAEDLEGQLRAGGRAFFAFVGDQQSAWFALLSGDQGPVDVAITTIRTRQARLIADLIAAAQPAADRTTVEALAHAINGSYEALALWWRDHPEATVDQLADLAARLLVPGLEALASDPG
jgi:AcrR family transcriptional regulator